MLIMNNFAPPSQAKNYLSPKSEVIAFATQSIIAASNWNNAQIIVATDDDYNDMYDGEL